MYNAYRKLEAMMRAVGQDDDGEAAEPMDTDPASSDAGTGVDEEDELPPAAPLLGGRDASKAEERLWFNERSRWVCKPYIS